MLTINVIEVEIKSYIANAPKTKLFLAFKSTKVCVCARTHVCMERKVSHSSLSGYTQLKIYTQREVSGPILKKFKKYYFD